MINSALASHIEIVHVQLVLTLWIWNKIQPEEEKDQQLNETIKEEAEEKGNEEEKTGERKEKDNDNKNLYQNLQQKEEKSPSIEELL